MGEKCFWRAALSAIRLNIIAEGSTELNFINKVLKNYLAKYKVYANVKVVLTSRDNKRHKDYKGGLVSYDKAKNDIITWIKQDNKPDVYFTTMFDYYGLPSSFPGIKQSSKFNDIYQKIHFIENEFQNDIQNHIEFTRFIPYIQLHEFEALLFSNPQKIIEEYFEYEKQIQQLIKIKNKFNNNPELINNSINTAPSKRLINLIPEYDKANIGPLIAERIGIEMLMTECSHFDSWINKLIKLSN